MLDIAIEKRLLADFHRSLLGRRILVIEGNRSAENLIYKAAAPDETRGIVSIAEGLRALDLDHAIVPSDSPLLAEHIAIADLVMIYAHGEYGEDGRLQGWLDYLGKPYPGPGVLASAVCLDKLTFKRLVFSAGLETPPFEELPSATALALEAAHRVGFPLMVKLRTGGSSIGIHHMADAKQFSAWLRDVPRENRSAYFLERFVVGRFLTAGIVRMSREDLHVPILEVRTPGGFYDEKTKLGADCTSAAPEFLVPAPVSAETAHRIDSLCRDAYQLTGCSGLARVDLMLDEDDVPWLLEINTIPGLSRKSNLTCAFMHLGFTYEELLLAVLRTARPAPMAAGTPGAPESARPEELQRELAVAS